MLTSTACQESALGRPFDMNGGVAQCETQLAGCRAGNALRKRPLRKGAGAFEVRELSFGIGFGGRAELGASTVGRQK